MRLLKIDENGQLTITKDLPEAPAPYAILSHRWADDDDDEVAFDNWDKESSQSKPGYAKVTFCAARARHDGLKYFWVDTCCINKNSHVELDTSIRSMFRWYQEADRCYVYFPDVVVGETNDNSHLSPLWKSAFRTSTWFQRGWTLQELLAPKVVEFFSSDRQYLGSKAKLEQEIHEITEIPVDALRGRPLSSFSIEQRFDWAEKRNTKMVEDKAYCLFGIFRVFLPLMYGEGENALRRLREEIGITTGQIDAAIQQAYRGRRLEVERLSGKSLPLEDCYINLCIVSHQRDSEAKPDRYATDDQSASERQTSRFSLAARLRVETPPESNQTSLNTLFDIRRRKDGSEFRPNRILIWGVAGMGKTTLCKKMVHDFYRNGLWNDLYDRVVWLPLRRFRLTEYQADDTVQLIKREFFSSRSDKNLATTIENVVILDPRTLFILDGLDEVSYNLNLDTSIGRVLNDLLARSHIIVTSRPHSTGMLDHVPPDLELETIGFYPQQLEEYIRHTAQQTSMSDNTVSEIRAFIKDRPLVQSLARIPVQLDAICYAWNTKHFPRDNVTMTTLYQAISQQLWAKDAVRKGKQINGQSVTQQQIEQSSNLEVLVKADTEFLQELAIQGLCKEIIEFDTKDIRRLQMDQLMLGDTLVYSSFLRSSDNSLEASDRTLHFIHLTFQEFFGAQCFVRHWTSGTVLSLWTSLLYGLSASKAKSIIPKDFVKKEKYIGRYDIFWRFVTGLLYMEPDLSHLYRFLEVLQEEPSDLVGLSHQRLMIHILSEISPADNDIQKTVREYEDDYLQWVLCESKLKNPGSRTSLMWEAECSDYILEALLEKKETQGEAMKVLCYRVSVSSKILETVLNMVKNMENTAVRQAAIHLLWQQGRPVHEKEFIFFGRNVQNLSKPEQYKAAYPLQQSQHLEQPAIAALIALFRHREVHVRSQAAWALHCQTSLSNPVIDALITLFQHPEAHIQSRIGWAHRCQTSLSNPVIDALITLLQHTEAHVRSNAALLLSRQISQSGPAIDTLIALLQDSEVYVRSQAARALSGQTSLSDPAIVTLIALLQDPEVHVRSNAASALGGQTSLSDPAIIALITLLQDPEAHVQSEAASALCRQTSLSDPAIDTLIALLQDSEAYIRSQAAWALSGQTSLSDPVVDALIALLQDPEAHVRSRVAWALSGQTSLSNPVGDALITLLQDPEALVRSEAASALRHQTSLSNPVVDALITLLQDPEVLVRSQAALAFYCQTSLSDPVINALITLLQDPEAHIRSNAALVLSRQTSLSDPAITALIALLQHSEQNTWSHAAHLLLSCKEAYNLILSLNSFDLQKILRGWFQKGSVTCSVWNRNFCINIDARQWEVSLKSKQEARLKTTLMEAQKALGLPLPLSYQGKE